ncbi:MAG: ATP-dependent 6-phosphofructokinase, partial [Deltaproteobacteria bacterium]|nr:ATP-dependent 6-phosphofructokinase [Deltaproteobacteria bacterium]
NTGGGDAPGLNAVIRAVALSARFRGWDVLGIRYGYRGLIEDDPAGIVKLDRDAVRGITHLGGTILGSTNRGDPFQYPVPTPNGVVARDVSDLLVRRARELGIDALVAIGGDGSLSLAARLVERGLPRVVGVPKTIDNDLLGTDVTFGFQTAVATATDALDKVHSTAQAHERIMVVELMGRYAGWIALHAGIAGSADAILIPEIPFELGRVAEKVLRRQRRGRPFSIIVVAEGARPAGGDRFFAGGKEAFKEHARLGGVGAVVAAELERLTGKEARTLVLGHLQRGGAPTSVDRLLALRLGCAATRYLAEDDTGGSGMVSVSGRTIRVVPLSEVATGTRTVPLDSEVLRTGRDLGICFGDEAPGTFLDLPLLPPPPGAP